MATTDTPTKTAAPRRRAAATKATPKAAPAKAAATAPAEDTTAELQKVGPFELIHDGDTKSYAKFLLDKDTMGAVGTVYAPLGTTMVKVVFYGEDDTEE